MSGRGPGEAGLGEASSSVTVHVQPRASKEGVAGVAGGALRVRLTAPAVENRANEALVRFLSDALGVPRSSVEIIAGLRGRRKVVRVAGIPRAEIFRRLALEEPPD